MIKHSENNIDGLLRFLHHEKLFAFHYPEGVKCRLQVAG